MSDYGYGNVDAFCRVLKENGVALKVAKEKEWLDYGGPEKRDRSGQQLREQFQRCAVICRSLLNGKLFYCPRSSNGDDLGRIPAKEGEWLDF